MNRRSSPLPTLETAVLLARGLEGFMRPDHGLAGPEHALALLELAGRIQDAEERELARCDAEIEAILAHPDVRDGTAPAWWTMVGLLDWEWEKRLIAAEGARAKAQP